MAYPDRNKCQISKALNMNIVLNSLKDRMFAADTYHAQN